MAGFPLVLLAVASLLSACARTPETTDYTASEPVSFRVLANYFLKNTVDSDARTNYFVARGEKAFSSLFGMATTMTSKPTPVDFAREIVVGVSLPTSDLGQRVAITGARLDEGSLYVEFSVASDGRTTHKSTPLAIASVPRAAALDVVFVQDGQEVKRLPLGARTAGSPRSYQELTTGFMGAFSGVLPCADCEGIETQLTLRGDRSFSLTQAYQGKTDAATPETTGGSWEVSGDLTTMRLTDPEGALVAYWRLDNKDSLTRLDMEGKPIDSAHNYSLRRTR
ncbi:hypothetical protein FACS1894186_0620 [Alphaproteobacteria bacterium]|nr:hypothetical protein FACS1894186_0620 [Alphaproteobacteria bacterium]